MLLFLASVFAAEAQEKVAPMGSAASQLSTVVLALLFVIGAIYASVWGMKRLGQFNNKSEGSLKILSGLMVGPKERVVLIECEGQKLLLGVANGQVSYLHTVDAKQKNVVAPSFEMAMESAQQDARHEE